MKQFNYYQPTEIIYGEGRINELGEVVKKYGNKCLLVTTPVFPAVEDQYAKVKQLLMDSGIEIAHFDQVQPNPTTEIITAGAEMAKSIGAEVVIGLGGGSSMDSAKAIAVEATHEGSCWDYLFFKKEPTEATLPIIAISTTSGTGSQVTQVAVVTNTAERDKSALYHPIIYPNVCIVDPELMITVPQKVTAATGFDALCHSFESTLNPGSNEYINTMGFRSIELVVETLPYLLKNLDDQEARSKMAMADTYGGLCIANSGVTLPHGVGMAISGMYPNVPHGESLAIIYPQFSRFTYKSAIPEFARIGRILNDNLNSESDEVAAERACDEIDKFLQEIGLWVRLKDYGMPEGEIDKLAKQSMVLPDYKANPKVASDEEMLNLIQNSYSLQ
ncbi:MAG: iron-containing alcohol dehydrogenase [Melioribacteraceae bacterium]|nr:iron-containing alcohol dehydrogenase [Melioribacteraceae bacterium]